MRKSTAIYLFLTMLLCVVSLVACGETEDSPDTPSPSETVMTLEELASFDGKEGRPAYVAVDGIVYDVSDSMSWPEGEHSPCGLNAMAGKDLSETIAQAPARMRALLASMPVVGRLE